MTREQAKEFIDAFVKLRATASDESALEAHAVYPTWKEDVIYTPGERVLYNKILYRVLQEHTSQADWTPDAASSLFVKVLIPDDITLYAWEQPSSTNPYMIGDKVTHNGKVWVSTVDSNVWEPGVYGWEEVI